MIVLGAASSWAQHRSSTTSTGGTSDGMYVGGQFGVLGGSSLWLPYDLVDGSGSQFGGFNIGSINPEIDQGFGLSNTLGVDGFTSGEAYKVGFTHPYIRVPRFFVQQTIRLGGSTEAVDAGLNQFRSTRTTNRLVATVGKFSVSDVFDTIGYAHDPRSDFMNWSLVDAGMFDYAADAWGFTYGAALEWYRGHLAPNQFQQGKVLAARLTSHLPARLVEEDVHPRGLLLELCRVEVADGFAFFIPTQ